MAAPGSDDNGNGRVTLAVLQNDVKHQTAILEELRHDFKEYTKSNGERIRDVELRQQATDEAVETLKKGSRNWDIVTGLTALGAGIVAILKGQ